MLEREAKDFPRKILEAIHIKTLNPKLNREKGLELDPVWDNILATKETKGQMEILLWRHQHLWRQMRLSITRQYNITAITTAEDAGRPGESAPVSVIFCSVEVQT